MWLSNIINKIKAISAYCWTGVWHDPRSNFKVRLIKTINLCVRAFLDRGLQAKSMSLTYSTVLAIVPALALLLAILRGFGFQDLLAQGLEKYLPGKVAQFDIVMSFVDHYLKEASSGIFVGVGILVLIWTLVSLLSNIENTFNNIWDVTTMRSLYQKITDYTAICLVVPVMMICSSGLSIFMSTTLQNRFNLTFLTPVINLLIDFMPLILIWLAFTCSFQLIPHTKVKIKYSMISGAICAVVFQILQLLFVNGQIYVSKYNAIYGSFSFLPLLLIWLQLSWLICLFGCVLTFSMQNVLTFNYLGSFDKISPSYYAKLVLVVTCIIFSRFANHEKLLTRAEISKLYMLPMRIVGKICNALNEAALVNYVIMDEDDQRGMAPAIDADTLTVGLLFDSLLKSGKNDFIPGFNHSFIELTDTYEKWIDMIDRSLKDVKVISLPIPKPEEIMKYHQEEVEKYSAALSYKWNKKK